jgi:hypothetical protein
MVVDGGKHSRWPSSEGVFMSFQGDIPQASRVGWTTHTPGVPLPSYIPQPIPCPNTSWMTKPNREESRWAIGKPVMAEWGVPFQGIVVVVLGDSKIVKRVSRDLMVPSSESLISHPLG